MPAASKRVTICLALRPASIKIVVFSVETTAQLPELPLPRMVRRNMGCYSLGGWIKHSSETCARGGRSRVIAICQMVEEQDRVSSRGAAALL